MRYAIGPSSRLTVSLARSGMKKSHDEVAGMQRLQKDA